MTDMAINLLFETQNLKVKGEGQQKILIGIVNLHAKYHILMMKYCLKIQSAKNKKRICTKSFHSPQMKGKQYCDKILQLLFAHLLTSFDLPHEVRRQ